MKAHRINREKIYEAYVIEPYESDPDIPFGGNSHGWQVVLVVGYTSEMFPIKIVVDKQNEQECIELIDTFCFYDL